MVVGGCGYLFLTILSHTVIRFCHNLFIHCLAGGQWIISRFLLFLTVLTQKILLHISDRFRQEFLLGMCLV